MLIVPLGWVAAGSGAARWSIYTNMVQHKDLEMVSPNRGKKCIQMQTESQEKTSHSTSLVKRGGFSDFCTQLQCGGKLLVRTIMWQTPPLSPTKTKTITEKHLALCLGQSDYSRNVSSFPLGNSNFSKGEEWLLISSVVQVALVRNYTQTHRGASRNRDTDFILTHRHWLVVLRTGDVGLSTPSKTLVSFGNLLAGSGHSWHPWGPVGLPLPCAPWAHSAPSAWDASLSLGQLQIFNDTMQGLL